MKNNVFPCFAPYLVSETESDRDAIKIKTFILNVPLADKKTIPDLPKTYQNKTRFSVNGKSLFGELAILELLKLDGWQGAWLDTFHSKSGKPKFWNEMPPKGVATIPGYVQKLIETIKAKNNNKLSGFFDVIAWRGNEIIFLEFKGPRDKSNKNEISWIHVAMAAGIAPNQLFFVFIK